MHTNQNAIAINVAITNQINIPHQVVNGIRPTEYEVAKTEVALVIKIITKKYGQVIEESPATKHKTSSGNIGNKNIMDKIK